MLSSTRLSSLFIVATVMSFSLILVRSVGAQSINNQVNVNGSGNNIVGDAGNEPSIAVDPNNPNRIAIGWRQFDTVTNNFRQAGVGFSTNGGLSWTATKLDPGQFRSDPVLDYDRNGNFYYSSLSSVTSMEVFKSTNGGATWSSPVIAHGGDKQWMAIDRTTGIGSGNIYQYWNVQFTSNPGTSFTRSINGGASFQTAIAGPSPDIKWGTLDVGHNGTLYFAGSQLNTGNGHLFAKSTNAQNPSQTPVFSAAVSINLGGTTSTGGVNPAGLLGQVNIATDHSFTSKRGNIYVLASVDPAGADPLDVMFIRSQDDGATWSAPVRINNDLVGSASQWFGTMSVAPNGRIDAIWNDTRNSPTSTTSQLFFANSYDGGLTWLGNKALTIPFNQSLGYPNQNKMGDYYDMISDEFGAHLAYAATFNGEQDVYYMRINSVPEPSSLAIAGLGTCLLAITVVLRRRKRSSPANPRAS